MLIISILENLLNHSQSNKDINNKNLYEYRLTIEAVTDINSNILIREVNYNQSNLFLWSLIFYILTLTSLLIISIFRFNSINLNLLPVILIIIGFSAVGILKTFENDLIDNFPEIEYFFIILDEQLIFIAETVKNIFTIFDDLINSY